MELMTLGHAAATFQQDPRLIEVALRAVQVRDPAEPELVLNGLRYFKTEEIVAAVGWIAERHARRAAEQADQAAEAPAGE